MYSRLHASATAVVQLFFVSFARTILLSITTKSSSAKLYFFFDLAPYCHKKSLESICFGYNRHFLWGVRYHFIVWPNLKLAAVETVLKAKLIHTWIPNFQANLYITSTLNIDLILWPLSLSGHFWTPPRLLNWPKSPHRLGLKYVFNFVQK